MQKFGYTFDGPEALAHNDANVTRVTDVVRASGWTELSIERHSSGCIQLYVFLPSMAQFFTLERALRAAGLRGAQGLQWVKENPS
jgi:hypothetical protein